MGNVEWTALQNNLLSLWFPGHAQIPVVVTLIALKKKTIDYIHLLHFSSISKCLGKQPISDYRNVNCVSRNRYVCVIVLPSDTGNGDKWVQLTKGLFKMHSSGTHLQGSRGCWASLTHYQTDRRGMTSVEEVRALFRFFFFCEYRSCTQLILPDDALLHTNYPVLPETPFS